MTTVPKYKTIQESAIQDNTYKVFPSDLNHNGTVFGGLIMAMLDRTALIVAERHSGNICVTVSVDAMHFVTPAIEKDVLIFKAAVNRAWSTSMEIGVTVIAEQFQTREIRHILSAYFTFVAVDENQKPVRVPEVIPETEIEKRRYEEANLRRIKRLQEAKERNVRRQLFSQENDDGSI